MLAFIGIPAMSAMLFMLAGLLIGYLLWHRDRSADKRALRIAEQKAQHARHVARLRKTAFIKLRDASPSTAHDEQTRQRDEHAHELGRTRSRLDAAVKKYQDLQRRLEETQQERAVMEKARDQQQSENDRLRAQQTTTGERLQKTERELRDVRNINQQLQTAIDEQSTEFEELTQRLAANAHVEEKLEEAERCTQSLTAKLQTQEETIAEQQQAIDAATQEKDQLIAQVESLQPLLRDNQTTTRELVAELQQKTKAIGDLQSRSQQMEQERNILQRSNEKLKCRLTELASSVGRIEQQLTAAEERNQETMAAQADAAEKFQRQAERIAKLQDEVKRAESYREKVAVFEAKVRQLTTALRQIGGEQQANLHRIEKRDGPGEPFGAPDATHRAA